MTSFVIPAAVPFVERLSVGRKWEDERASSISYFLNVTHARQRE